MLRGFGGACMQAVDNRRVIRRVTRCFTLSHPAETVGGSHYLKGYLMKPLARAIVMPMAACKTARLLQAHRLGGAGVSGVNSDQDAQIVRAGLEAIK